MVSSVLVVLLIALSCMVRSAPISSLAQQLEDSFAPASSFPEASSVDGEEEEALEVAESQRVFSSGQESQSLDEKRNNLEDADLPPSKMLEEFIDFGRDTNLTEDGSIYKLGYSVNDGKFKSFRYEEKTPEGLIVGELGYHSDGGNIRGVRYTAEAGVHPKVLYDALLKFFSL